MSSVLRFQKQRPSNTLFNGDNGNAQGWLYSTIVSYAESNTGVITAPSIITFPTFADLSGCTNDLNNNQDVLVDEEVAIRDMGETLYMGVEGEDSTQVVLKLVQIIQGDNQGWLVYINAKDVTNNTKVYAARGAW